MAQKLNIEVPDHLKSQLEKRAAANDRTLTAEVRRALVAYLQEAKA